MRSPGQLTAQNSGFPAEQNVCHCSLAADGVVQFFPSSCHLSPLTYHIYVSITGIASFIDAFDHLFPISYQGSSSLWSWDRLVLMVCGVVPCIRHATTCTWDGRARRGQLLALIRNAVVLFPLLTEIYCCGQKTCPHQGTVLAFF